MARLRPLRPLLAGLAAMAMAGVLFASPAAAAGGDGSGGSGTAGSGSGSGSTSSTVKPSTATFGIQPATAKGIDTRDSLSYEATGGSTKIDYVAITNYTTGPLQLHVYATDAYNSSDGGFTVLPSATKPTDIGLWVSFGQQFLTVPAKTTVIIPFRLSVPLKAGPGDHMGGIMVALTTMAYDAKGNQIAIESRVGTRLSVRVPGQLNARLGVSNVSVSFHDSVNPFGSGSATVSYTVTNTGNVRLAGTQAVRVTSLVGGSEQSTAIAAIKELLPGDSMRVTTHVNGVLPSLTSTVRIDVAGAAVAGDIDPKVSSAEQSATMIAMPWSLLVLLVLIGTVGYLLWRRRRRAKADAEAEAAVGGAGKGGAGSNGGGNGKGGSGGSKTGPKPSTPAAAKAGSGNYNGGSGSKSPKATAPRPKVTAPVPKTGTKAGAGGAKSARPIP